MYKVIATAIVAAFVSTSAFALEACGPEINAGFETARTSETGIGNTVSDEVDSFGDVNTLWNDDNANVRGKDLSFQVGITWVFGHKEACDKANAAETDLLLREGHVLAKEAKELEATTREANAVAEAAETETLIAKISFCIDTQFKYEELGRELPASVVEVCGDLL